MSEQEMNNAEKLSKRMAQPYSPIIKERGFNPSPVAGNIPYYANAVSNPKCVGTTAYNEFWDEQFYYCLNGYYTGGIFIPPKMYHYLNFTILSGVGRGEEYPMFTDLHYQLFMLEYEIRNDTSILGITIPKARRKGLSFFGTQMANYGFRFTDKYRMGVAAGLGNYVDGFSKKLHNRYNNTVEEMKMNFLKKNDKEFEIGYVIKDGMGGYTLVHGDALYRTMEDDARKLEGEYFHDVIAEEAGEFQKAKEMITSVRPALMDGHDIVGKIFIYGTGGSMNKGGKTFMSIWKDNREFRLVNFFIKGSRFFIPFLRMENKKYSTPYLDARYPDLAPEQLLGCEDERAAQEALDATAEEVAKSSNKKELIEHKQNFPDTVEDVFMSSGTNHFDTEKLYRQNYRIDSQPEGRKWVEMILEWEKDSDGNIAIPLKVISRFPKKSDPEWSIVNVYKKPEIKFKGNNVCGIDGYNEDKTDVNDSLGGITVVRLYERHEKDKTVDEPGQVPILTYYKRPPRKEQFWDLCLKIAVWYEMIGMTMIAAESDLVIEHFKNNYGRKYLARRPKKFDSPNSKKKHEFGVKMDSYTKPRMLGLMQTWVEDNVQYSWFKELNLDLATYDEGQAGEGDWDLADSLGIALTKIADMRKIDTPKKEQKESYFPEWGEDSNGNIVLKNKLKVKKEKTGTYLDLPNAFGDDLT